MFGLAFGGHREQITAVIIANHPHGGVQRLVRLEKTHLQGISAQRPSFSKGENLQVRTG